MAFHLENSKSLPKPMMTHFTGAYIHQSTTVNKWTETFAAHGTWHVIMLRLLMPILYTLAIYIISVCNIVLHGSYGNLTCGLSTSWFYWLTRWSLGGIHGCKLDNDIFHRYLRSYHFTIGPSVYLADDKSTLIQVVPWCRQAPSHHPSQCLLRFMASCCLTRPQWIKTHCNL